MLDSLQYLSRLLRQYPMLYSTLLIAPTVGVIQQLSIPYALKFILNAIETHSSIFNPMVIFIITWMLAKLLTRFQVWNSANDLSAISTQVREQVIQFFLNQPIQLQPIDTSTHAGKTANDLAQTIERIWGIFVWQCAPQLISALFILIHIFYLNPLIAMNIMAYFCIQMMIIRLTFSKLQHGNLEHRKSYLSLLSNIHDLFQHPLNLHLFPAKDYLKIKIQKKQSQESFTRQTQIKTLNTLRFKVDCLSGCMLSLNFLILYRHPYLHLGDMSFIVLTSIHIIDLLWQCGHCLTELNQECSKLNYLSRYLKIHPPQKKIQVNISKGRIIMENIHFAYTRQKPIFNGLNLIIRENEITDIQSPSGHGKTTLLYLILGLLKPQKGRMMIDQYNINHLLPPQIRQLINVIPQVTQLFNKSILDNLSIAKPNASKKELLNALKLAYCEPFIERLKDGIYTNATLLSGGQKQQLGIARALLKPAPIWIIDEGLCAIDQNTHDQIMSTLIKRQPFKSLIMMRHRQRHIHFATREINLHRL